MLIKSWEQYHSDIKRLTTNLGSYRPDVIVPCMLGGMIPGAIIAKELGIKDVRPIDIEREGDKRRLAYDAQGDIRGKNVLILEDDMPTGRGTEYAKQLFEERGAKVKIAAVYVTPDSQKVADFYVEIAEELPNYPWKRFNSGDRLRN